MLLIEAIPRVELRVELYQELPDLVRLFAFFEQNRDGQEHSRLRERATLDRLLIKWDVGASLFASCLLSHDLALRLLVNRVEPRPEHFNAQAVAPLTD